MQGENGQKDRESLYAVDGLTRGRTQTAGAAAAAGSAAAAASHG